MVTCLVWAGVLVLVLLLLLVVGLSLLLATLPLWPPLLVAVIVLFFLVRLRLAAWVKVSLAGTAVLALAIDLPSGLRGYSLALTQIGYTGALGSALAFGVADLPRLLWLSLPFCLLSGAAAGSGLAALRSLGETGGRPRPRRHEATHGGVQE